MALGARRVIAAIPLLLAVTFAASAMTLLLPGDPAIAIAGQGATQPRIDEIRADLGLDRSVVEQYGSWLGDALGGDLGTSLYGDRSVTSMISSRLPATLSLTAATLLVTILVSVPLGIASALHRGRALDRVITVGSSIGMAMPSFWVGMILVVIFAINLGWFPATGYVALTADVVGWARSIALPTAALAAVTTAEATRQLRAAMIDVLDQDYIRTAWAKGLTRRNVVYRHALKNAVGPMATILGLQVSALLGGALIVEQVFAIPGLGQLAVRAVLDRDVPMIQGVVVVAAIAVLIANLAVDLVHGYITPKARHA